MQRCRNSSLLHTHTHTHTHTQTDRQTDRQTDTHTRMKLYIRFRIPPKAISKEEILTEFEIYYNQVDLLLKPTESGKREVFRSKMTSIAHEYANIKLEREIFPLGKEHFAAIRELRNNKEIVITRPDKGAGVVLLDHAEYIAKMMEILDDDTLRTFLPHFWAGVSHVHAYACLPKA